MANTFLYRSLTQDLKSLDNLTKTMMINNSLETHSWLDPRKTFLTIDDIRLFCIKDEEGRLKCLELIIDRLYIILNLSLNYLEKSDKMKIKLRRNVKKPKGVTLGLSANLLWERIQHLCENVDLYTSKTIKNTGDLNHTNEFYVDKQTQCSEFDNCRSCKTARECIHLLTRELLHHAEDNDVSEAKKNIQNNIYEMTQEESMLALTSAIKNDIGNVIKKNQDLKLKVENQETSWRNLNYNYQDALRKDEELLLKIEELEKSKEENIQKLSEMQHKINKIYFDKHQIEKNFLSEKEKFGTLQKKFDRCNENLDSLRFQVQSLQKDLNSVLNREDIANAEKELWKAKFASERAENKKLHTINDDLRTTVNTLEENLHDVNKKIDKAYEEVCTRAETYKDLLRKTQDVVESNAELKDKIANEIGNFSNSSNTVTGDFEVQGNPLFDMMKQVEVNKLSMQKLENQNAVLMKTIQKFKFRVSEKS